MKKVIALLVTVLLVLTSILLMYYISPYAVGLLAITGMVMPIVLFEVFSK